MAAVTICSDSGAQENKSVTVSIVSPAICHKVMGLDALTLVFEYWILSQEVGRPRWKANLILYQIFKLFFKGKIFVCFFVLKGFTLKLVQKHMRGYKQWERSMYIQGYVLIWSVGSGLIPSGSPLHGLSLESMDSSTKHCQGQGQK